MAVPRILNPQSNPTGYLGIASALYAAGFAIYNWHVHKAPLDWNVIWAAAVAIGSGLWVRGKVTPLADPRDGNGKPLTPPLAAVLPWTGPEPPYVKDLRDRLAEIDAQKLPMPPTGAGPQPGVTLAEPTYPPPPSPPQATT